MAKDKPINALEIIKNIPNCIVINCPSEVKARNVINKILKAEYNYPGNTPIYLISSLNRPSNFIHEYVRTDSIRAGKIKRKLPKKSIWDNDKFENRPLSVDIKKCKTQYLLIFDMFDVASPSFDKELMTLLKSTKKDKFSFVGLTQVNSVSQLKLKNSLELLHVYDYELFKDIIDGKSSLGTVSEQKSPVKKVTDFDKMQDGHSFEAFCAELLQKNGFENVIVTSGSGDQGIDILCRKEEVKYGIQCKCYSKDIGNKAVQEAYSGAQFYKCHVPVVMTNRDFTSGARSAAEKTNVLLWNRHKLETLIKNADKGLLSP